MWTTRFWNVRMWATRFWCKVGGVGILADPPAPRTHMVVARSRICTPNPESRLLTVIPASRVHVADPD